MNEPTDRNEEQTTMQNEAPVSSGQQVRKLTRNTDDKIIAGVASGLADYFRVDPILIRIAFVALLVLGGSGVILYVLLWLVMPEGPDQQSVGEQALRRRDWSAWVGVALIVIAIASLVEAFSLWEPDIIWGVGLMALGIWLVVRREPTPAPVTPEQSHAVPETTELASPSPAAVPVQRRPRSTLGLLTLGAALLASGVAVVVDNLSDVVDMGPPHYLALVLAVIGLGLLVGAWMGHSRGLIVLGLLLAPMVFVSGLIEVPFEGGAGERFWEPQTVAGIRDEYRLGAGSMRLDLSDVDFAGETVNLEASVAMGELIVIVPDNVGVDVTGQVSAGEIRAFGVSDEGLDIDFQSGIGGTEGHLNLEVEAGFGSVQVDQGPEVQ